MLQSDRNPYTRVLAAGLAVSCTGSAFAQPNLPLPDGQLNFTGSFQEFSVPNTRGTILRFTVFGADGGDATRDGGGCFNSGGQGATAVYDTVIGRDATRLNPRQPIRFIVGGAGGRGIPFGSASLTFSGGGGGGGSGVVYQSPDVAERNGWVLLSAAGGGGGAASGGTSISCNAVGENGQDARTVLSGGTGNDGNGTGGSGGENGEHGEPGAAGVGQLNGGGGGAFGPVPSTPNGGSIGGAGFGPTGDDPLGGAGDTAPDSTAANGGYGFGGGGAGGGGTKRGGGGGGGYSGGGGGGERGAGGGGGSFLNDAFQFGVAVVFENSEVGENGRIDYDVIGQSHDLPFNALELDIDDQGNVETPGLAIGAFPSPIAGVPNTGSSDVWYTYTNTSDGIESFRLNAGVNVELVGLINGSNPFVDVGGTLATSLLPGDQIDIRVAVPPPSSGSFILSGRIFPDADGDGVPDDSDLCPGEDDLLDTDGDGVGDCLDLCPGFDDLLDSDGDAIPDCLDACPGEDDLLDSDGDTVPDCLDVCPGEDDLFDSDGDTVPNCLDVCPGEDDLLDTDGDGVVDCLDICPGADDLLDSDGDGVPDCLDICPGEDDLLDSDGDTVPDCADNCPDDPNVVNTDSGMIYATLGEAIEDASRGDTLQLGACVFNEAGFQLVERDLTIRGRGMGETIIDAQGQPRIFVFDRDNTTIEDMSLLNTVAGDSSGGVADLRAQSTPVFTRVEMAGHDGTGGQSTLIQGLSLQAAFTLDGCWIHSNTASESNSMTFLLDSDQRTTVINTVFANNAGSERRSVLRFQGNVDVAVVNSTFAGNEAANAVQIIANTSSIDIVNTVSDIPLFSENALVTAASSVFPGATGNNLDAMPAFTDAANGDYTLLPGSAGIDLGNPVAFTDAGGGDVDILGNPRIVDDLGVPNAFSDPIDAGAFESQVVGGGCSAADIALPFGVLDLGDIDAFIAGFLAGDPLADVADPIGVLDLGDIDSFITAFTDGCP